MKSFAIALAVCFGLVASALAKERYLFAADTPATITAFAADPQARLPGRADLSKITSRANLDAVIAATPDAPLKTSAHRARQQYPANHILAAADQPKSCTVNSPAWWCSSISLHALITAHSRLRFLAKRATTT